jgi:septum formation protein
MHQGLRMTSPALVLASTSRYRRELLLRLGVPFTCVAPGVDETPLPGETPLDTAIRLAAAKARAVRPDHHALVIGSDQVAMLDGQPLGKPGDRRAAIGQLRAQSGREVAFHTAVCIHDTATGREGAGVDTTTVRFRTLSDATIERYVDLEQPFDCAGSAKSEGLGIALLESVRSTDPTGLVGLPLILVTTLLAEHGLFVL